VSTVVAYTFRWGVVSGSFDVLLRSVRVTLELSVLGLVCSLALGLVVALCRMAPFAAGVIALTMLFSAYMAEVYRSALGAVDPGQREAAFSLGFSRTRTFGTVVFPQAFRIALPSLTNLFVDIVKDSSIIAVVGTADLMGTTNQLNGLYRAPFELYTTVACFYITLVLVLSAAAALLERRLNRHVR